MIEMVVAIVEMVVGAVTHAASRTADGANMLAAVEMRSGIDADTAAAGDMTAAEAADTAATHVPAGEAAAAHMAAAAAAAEAAATLNEGQAARRLKRIREVGRRGDGRG
jgi:hypothetical protein